MMQLNLEAIKSIFFTVFQRRTNKIKTAYTFEQNTLNKIKKTHFFKKIDFFNTKFVFSMNKYIYLIVHPVSNILSEK